MGGKYYKRGGVFVRALDFWGYRCEPDVDDADYVPFVPKEVEDDFVDEQEAAQRRETSEQEKENERERRRLHRAQLKREAAKAAKTHAEKSIDLQARYTAYAAEIEAKTAARAAYDRASQRKWQAEVIRRNYKRDVVYQTERLKQLAAQRAENRGFAPYSLEREGDAADIACDIAKRQEMTPAEAFAAFKIRAALRVVPGRAEIVGTNKPPQLAPI
jgi:hypothetical protein